MKHTPTPWAVDHDAISAQGQHIAGCIGLDGDDYATQKANAAHIVRCVNAHDDLVSALQMVCDSGVALADSIEKAMLDALAKARGDQ